MSFYENIDDEAWLRVNGELVLDCCLEHPNSGRVDFCEGGWYDLNFDSEMVLVEQVLRVLVGDQNWF